MDMVLIGVDGNEANVKNRVGVGQYAYGILNTLWKLKSKERETRIKEQIKFRIYLKDDPLKDLPKEKNWWNYKVFGQGPFWVERDLMPRLWREKFSGQVPGVFWSPTHYAPFPSPIPSVISIMDMSFERFPQYFKKKDLYQLKLWTAASARQAKKIFTISEFSKRDIVQHYGFDPDEVVVTYPGYDKRRFNAEIKNQKSKIKNSKKKYKIDGEYLLYLGTLQPRKNLVRLVKAFAMVKNKEQITDKRGKPLKNQSIKLVIAGMIKEGRGGWMYEEIFQKVKELGLEDEVIFTGFVVDKDVPYLYAGALAYVLPSLYEGFGIPPIEAMAVGTPVVVSKVSSLPEVCGEAAVYIEDPYNVESITEALEKMLGYYRDSEGGEGGYRRLQKFGFEQVKKYNWVAPAKKTLDVLVKETDR